MSIITNEMLERVGYVKNEWGDYYLPGSDASTMTGSNLGHVLRTMYDDWSYWSRLSRIESNPSLRSHHRGMASGYHHCLYHMLRMLDIEWGYQHGCGD